MATSCSYVPKVFGEERQVGQAVATDKKTILGQMELFELPYPVVGQQVEVYMRTSSSTM